METKHLYEFVCLAESGNYWQTSANLFISQSSLSKHIMSLERELGVSLFDRTTRRVRLSPDGELLLPYARKITRLLCEYDVARESRKKEGAGAISIASTPQMSHYAVITGALAQYKRENPGCSLTVIVEPHNNLKKLLLRHSVDFIWTGEPEDEAGDLDFVRIPFLTEPLVVVFSKGHPLSELDAISAVELQNQEFMIQDNSSVEQRIFLKHCREHGFEPRMTSLPGGSVLDFVRRGLGVAVMLRSVALNMSCADVAPVNLEDSPVVQVSLLYLKDCELTHAAAGFLAFLETARP
ncbi:MAG TPA: LysR family transcriptional regulator [Candidatus Acidoferrum sp.]|nr:LysR family transcriptional regulator [Candidatus Acidoferrum sp.]